MLSMKLNIKTDGEFITESLFNFNENTCEKAKLSIFMSLDN